MKIKSSCIVCFLIFGFFGFSQKVQLKKAASSYDQFHYVDAIKTYEKVANKGYKSVELFSKLGDSYYFQSNLNEANKWYEQLFALNQKVDSEYYFRYAQTLKSIGDYKKAGYQITKINLSEDFKETKKTVVELPKKITDEDDFNQNTVASQ